MVFGYCLGLGLASVVLFIGFLYFGIKSYKKRFALNFDIRNTFPYEINYGYKFLDNIGANALLVLFTFASISLYFFFGFYYFDPSKLTLLIAGIILSIGTLFIFFADLKYLRFHVLLVVLCAISAFLLPAGITIAGYVMFQQNDDIYPLVIAFISLFFAIFTFSLLMNPKLSFNLQMQKAIGEDGKETLIRPKFFVIAFTEWLFIFSILVDNILLILLTVPH